MELDAGQKVVIPNVGDAAVTGKPERVGEGLVYPVSLNGRDMLLKWYQKPTGDDLYRKIGSINGKAPSASSIWPQYRTEKNDDGSWGYFIGLPRAFQTLAAFSSDGQSSARFQQCSKLR